MKVYESEEEAEKEWLRHSRDLKDKMCPIFKTKCLELKCLSFHPGNIYIPFGPNGMQKGFKIITPCCSNAIVTGIIEYQEP